MNRLTGMAIAILFGLMAVMVTINIESEALEADHIVVIISTSEPEASVPFTIVLEIRDDENALVTDWDGEIEWTYSKMGGTRPGEINAVNGYWQVNDAWSLLEPGQQWINFTDTDRTIWGSAEFNVPEFTFNITAPNTVVTGQFFGVTVESIFTDNTRFEEYETVLHWDVAHPDGQTNFIRWNSPGVLAFPTGSSTFSAPGIMTTQNSFMFQDAGTYRFIVSDNTRNVSNYVLIEVVEPITPIFHFEQTEFQIQPEGGVLEIPFQVLHVDTTSGNIEFTAIWTRNVWIADNEIPELHPIVNTTGGTMEFNPPDEESSEETGGIYDEGRFTDNQIINTSRFSRFTITYTITEDFDDCPFVNISLDSTTYSGYSPHNFTLTYEAEEQLEGDVTEITILLYQDGRGLVDSVTFENFELQDDEEKTGLIELFSETTWMWVLLIAAIIIITLIGVAMYKR